MLLFSFSFDRDYTREGFSSSLSVSWQYKYRKEAITTKMLAKNLVSQILVLLFSCLFL